MKTKERTKPLYTQAMIEAILREYLASRLPERGSGLPCVHVGDRITARSYANAFWDGCGKPPLVRGEVVYVHPRGSFAMVYLTIGKTTIRECFSLLDLHNEEGD